MRPRLAVPLFSLLLLCATGCDLVSEPGGPRPEDFEVQEETSEVRAIEADDETADVELRQVAAEPLSTARGGITLSLKAPAPR